MKLNTAIAKALEQALRQTSQAHAVAARARVLSLVPGTIAHRAETPELYAGPRVPAGTCSKIVDRTDLLDDRIGVGPLHAASDWQRGEGRKLAHA